MNGNSNSAGGPLMTDRDDRTQALRRLSAALDGLDASQVGQLVALARRLKNTPTAASSRPMVTIAGAPIRWPDA